MHRLAPIAIALATLSLAACGENKVERGLSPPARDEVSTPESSKDMAETEQQRQRDVEQRMQEQQIEHFDEAEKSQP